MVNPRSTFVRIVLTLFVLFLWFCAGAQAQAKPDAPAGCAALLERWKSISVIPLEDWRVHPAGDFRGEASGLDDSAWEVKQKNQRWEAGSYWFRRWVEIPVERGGYSFRGARLELQIRFGWGDPVHKTVYVNGLQRALGEEFEPIVLTESAEPGQKFLIAVKAQAASGKLYFNGGEIDLVEVPGRPDVRMLLEECVTAEVMNKADESGERARQLEGARNTMDWAALESGDQKRFDDSLLAARTKIEPLRGWLKKYTVFAAGNAHIDMAWLWPWTETVEVTRDTFSSALKLMNEFPDFKFTHASARTYAWMEEKYPDLFRQIQRRAKEGRWEVVGGMWVEPDLNLSDGEALVRQVLVGKRYFQQKFGVDVRVGWNPDSFGYNWQLPQIYKRSGIDYFVTQKIGWNDTTKFPHKLFWWEAPDGSRILTYFPHDYVNSMDPLRIARDLATASQVTGLPEMLHLYGVGDHGGGPTRKMLETGRRWQESPALFPKLTLNTALDFFQTVEPKLGAVKVPVWRDELYLEYHRGTYTTQAKTKQNNRRSEALMLNTEKFSSIASLFGRAYPQEELNDAWRLVLFNQFHDILPGSSIAPVYVDSERDHAEVRRMAGGILSGALEEIAARVKTEGDGVPVVVFNSLAWARSEVIEAEVRLKGAPEAVQVRDASGKSVLAEVVARDEATERTRVRFLAREVPSLGYEVFHVRAAKKAKEKEKEKDKAQKKSAEVTATDDTLENEYLRVRLDAKSGCIASLFDKRRNKEVFAPGACGNLLQAFRDQPKDWDAWNIDADFEKEKWDLSEAEEVKLVESGPVRGVIRVVKKFQKSRFVQDITLYAGIPRVDVRTEADWQEDHILIKAAFPVAAQAEKATYEIPFGSIERSTMRRTPEEKGKFEVPALRWADLSDANGGLSVLNDSKYGYDAKDNVLRISLLRSPKWPDPNADMGRHEFTYSLYPHAGTWREAGTMRRGYELNNKLIAVVTQSHRGDLAEAHSFVKVTPENVALVAVKKAEDSDAWILRLYEFAGKETQASIEMPSKVSRAVETNLMEADEREAKVEDGKRVALTVRPFEIKTLRVDFAAEKK